MSEYHKIQTVWYRDPNNKYKTLLEGVWAKPEFEYLKDNQWVYTEKVDGTNIRVEWTAPIDILTFEGRTKNSQIPAFLHNKLQELFPEEFFKSLYPDVSMCLYGEGYGAKIQKGGGN